jgi:geranyl-CoA carboxylase alpha subunit
VSGFSKILIANRGEIACRVIRTARAMGYATVAVASEADAGALHARLADEVLVIGPAAVSESYLDPARILAAAKATGAQAIHPGYGYLSEKADFAQACADAGLVFIGPSPEAIAAMGDKAESKRRMIAAGVPCVPGYQGEDQSDARLTAEANAIGYPIMVKASAGGGGRGMRLVEHEAGLPAALVSARSEALHAFGDATLLLERAVIEPRHVEVQVFGDSHGNVIHLGERDCSVQRRFQKVIEEAPSPAVHPSLREAMGAAAVKAAQAIGYRGAGTVEFLLAADKSFYFLEMNTRLQVEHPVTEMVTGLDLVAWQIDVAAGKPLPLTQDQVALNGCAIEVRLYAEDPANGFLPQTGIIESWRPASGDGVRIDHGLADGFAVSPFYDPMLAKIVAHGADREQALRRLSEAVRQTVLFGPATNKAFLLDALAAPEFVAGAATTGFIGRTFPDGWTAPPIQVREAAIAAAQLCSRGGAGWSSNQWLAHPVVLNSGGARWALEARRAGRGWEVRCGDETFTVDPGAEHAILARDNTVHLDRGGGALTFTDETYAPPRPVDAQGDGVVRAPMAGRVAAVEAAPGDSVVRGQLLLVIEAMKMEHQVVAGVAGVVDQLAVQAGDQVAARDVLAVLTADEAGP